MTGISFKTNKTNLLQAISEPPSPSTHLIQWEQDRAPDNSLIKINY